MSWVKFERTVISLWETVNMHWTAIPPEFIIKLMKKDFNPGLTVVVLHNGYINILFSLVDDNNDPLTESCTQDFQTRWLWYGVCERSLSEFQLFHSSTLATPWSPNQRPEQQDNLSNGWHYFVILLWMYQVELILITFEKWSQKHFLGLMLMDKW